MPDYTMLIHVDDNDGRRTYPSTITALNYSEAEQLAAQAITVEVLDDGEEEADSADAA